MNKADLVTQVAAKTDQSKKVVDAVITATFESIVDAVASNDKVLLVNFGSFEPKVRSEREGRNPKTGAPLTIPAKTIPTFSAGKAFIDKVANVSE